VDSEQGGAWLWMNVHNQTKWVLDNMQNRLIRGNLDWERHEIVLDVPQDSINIGFGVAMAGKGQAWFDDLQFDVVGQDVHTTNTESGEYQSNLVAGPARQKAPLNLGFETDFAINLAAMPGNQRGPISRLPEEWFPYGEDGDENDYEVGRDIDVHTS